jgi:hypothetical protein
MRTIFLIFTSHEEKNQFQLVSSSQKETEHFTFFLKKKGSNFREMTLCAFPVIIQLDFEMFLSFFLLFLGFNTKWERREKTRRRNPRAVVCNFPVCKVQPVQQPL